jgi:PAS domain S-box-containing protein
MASASSSDTASRLDALADYEILDTEAEQGFDDIVELASQFCETPVALVSLVAEERQWFKARIGFEPCETPIGQSVCAHALDRTDPLVIPDLTLDPRTKGNPLVTGEPFIRFYAGAPLVTPGGVVVGTLCVIDRLPRPQGLKPDQLLALQALARQVVAQLELRKLYREENVRLRHEGTRARMAQEAGGIGTFELNVTTHELTVSPEFCRLFGLPVAATYAARTIEALIVQEDGAVRSSSRSRRAGNAPLDVEYRIHRADDGRLRWIARSARFLRDDNGQVLTMFGTVQDVTNRRRLQIYQDALLELGDRLREAEDERSVASVASDVLGRTLAVSRAGYARIDLRADTFEVETDWTAPGVTTLAGSHSLAAFRMTFDRLARNQAVAVANIQAAAWLEADRAG